MSKYTLLLLLALALLLAACGGVSPVSPTIVAPTAALPATSIPKTAATATSAGGGTLAEAPAGCTVISPKNTPGPTAQSLFPAVTDKDWSTGPKDASVTLIEYSDFQ